jgi:putative FmdB family regulatory protein
VPIYEYACPSCGDRFEELVRSPAVTPACPGCGSMEPERLLSVFAGAPRPAPKADYSRLAHHARATSGCCGGGCGHRH